MTEKARNIDVSAADVVSRDAHVAFVRCLADDALANHATWDTATIESFLGALGAWLDDADGYYANRGVRIAERSPWRVIADALAAARVDE